MCVLLCTCVNIMNAHSYVHTCVRMYVCICIYVCVCVSLVLHGLNNYYSNNSTPPKQNRHMCFLIWHVTALNLIS